MLIISILFVVYDKSFESFFVKIVKKVLHYLIKI